MVNIILYSTDEIMFDSLKSFKNNKFTHIAYGQINNICFVFGNFDVEIYNPEKKTSVQQKHTNM